MKRIAVLLAAVLLLAACGGDDTGPAAEDPTTDTGTTAPAPGEGTDTETEAMEGAVLATADSNFGTILVDGEGMTLYVFDNDGDGQSNCTGSCADTWPPLTGEVSAEGDVDAALIGSTERDDGSSQVTYDGQPLYYYAADSEPGETNGQGVGDIWWVVGPDGEKITEAQGAASSSEDDGSVPGY
ncbi:MAG: hypothetical protein R3343_05375 [Nitriliruptorales bacterium]|nr:hypothetical protein [Nitriliruptorales bacterium]